MEQWSILGNVLNYIQYDKHPKNYHSLSISAVNKEKYRRNSYIKEEEGDMLELDFGHTPDKLKEEYLDVYEGIQSEMLSTTRFDENSDLSTTYLGKVDRSKNNKIKVEESFSISKQGYTVGELLGWNRMPNTIRYSVSQYIIHVKITLSALQVTSLFAKICIQNSKEFK